MSTSNILSSWVAPDVDDDLPSQGRHKDGNTTTIGCVRQLVANPFSQANIAQAQSTFEMLIEDSVLYTGVIAPTACCLPLDLQNRLLLWLSENINALTPVFNPTTSLLRAIYGFYTSSGKSNNPLCTLAATLLENMSMELMDVGADSIPSLDAFAAALQSDLLGRLDSSLILLPSASYCRSALFELGHAPSSSEVGLNPELHASLMVEESDAPEDDLPDVIIQSDLSMDNRPTSSQPLDTSSTGPAEGDDDVNFESQLPTSSQHDTFAATMDIDADLPSILPESPINEPHLGSEEKDQAVALFDCLNLMDAESPSQVPLTRNVASILLENAPVNAVLAILNLATHADNTILALLEIVLSEDVSYARICSILSAALTPRVHSLSKAASRTLMNLLNFVVEKDARALLDSVLMPVVCSNGFASPHVEMIVRMIKALSATLQDLYIDKLLSGPENFVLAHLDLIAKILPIRSAWSTSLLRLFVTHLYRHLEDPFVGGKPGEKFQAIVWVLLQKAATADLAEHKDNLIAVAKKYPSAMGEKSLAKLAQF